MFASLRSLPVAGKLLAECAGLIGVGVVVLGVGGCVVVVAIVVVVVDAIVVVVVA
jgi:hypothetical protein